MTGNFFFYHNKSLITETVQEHFPIDGSLWIVLYIRDWNILKICAHKDMLDFTKHVFKL